MEVQSRPGVRPSSTTEPLEVCVFGAGAVGGYLAARLALAGRHAVSVIARGQHLAAIRERGLELQTQDATETVRLTAAEESATRLPPQDIVFVTLKAPALPSAADSVRSLLKPGGHAVFVTNGVPWWWNHGLPGDRPSGRNLVDPDQALWNRLGPERAVGCVVYSLNEVTRPGTVAHRGNNRWIVGEPSNEVSPRLLATGDLLSEAGLQVEISQDLRQQVWNKLLRNTPFNSLSALTRLGTDRLGQVPSLLPLAQALTDEVVRVARAKGFQLPDARASDVLQAGGSIGGGAARGVKPSMLQDVLAGRQLEADAIVGQVHQFAREENVPTPALDMLCALLRGLDHGLRQPA